MEKNKTILLPGDYICSIEEFLPGFGVMEYNGNLYACIGGYLNINYKERKVEIKPLKFIPGILKKNLIVIARIKNIFKSILEVEIQYIEDYKKNVNYTGYILFTKSQNTLNFKLEDILRAKIIAVEENILLSLKGEDFGVIYASCPSCLNILTFNSKTRHFLYCKKCGYVRKTKISNKYLVKEKIK